MNDQDMDSELSSRLGQLTGAHNMTETVSYGIYGAVVTTTRAFEKVTLKLDANTNRIFVAIRLRWWAKYGKFKPLQDAWLRIAEKRTKEYVPSGWKILIYYSRDDK